MSEAASTHEAADAWSQWAARYRDVRAATDALCAPLSAEDSAVQSMPDASPAKWHLAHTTWFFEVFVLAASDPSHELYQPLYLELFNSYYNAIGPQYPRPERGLLTRPSLEEVKAYREHVDRGVLERLAAGDVDLDTLELGLHHEQQHQELILTDIKHLFSRNPSFPAYRARGVAAAARPPEPLRWHAFEGGVRSIGHDGRGFAFDNEEPRHARVIEPFELASRTITNGEFSEFIDDGGYDEPQLWLSDGWQRSRGEGWEAPLYWTEVDGERHALTLHGLEPLPPEAPVCHLSFYEADAFARWAGARLPDEAEWELAAVGADVEGNFVESGELRPARVPAGASAPAGLYGDVWEWTRSPYAAYPGYRPPEGDVAEYNGKFMSNQFVLRGGSCATPRSHIRATYRNFFPPDARWQFSGLRLARDVR